MSDLLTVDYVLERILDQVTVLPAERVSITQALGRILAQDVIAEDNIPPFANSSMDGYAVRSADVAFASLETPVYLTPVLDIPAGMPANRPIGPGEAARIMTGALLPEGADAVVPVEQTNDHWKTDGTAPLPARVAIFQSVPPKAYVRPEGEDIRAGQRVLRAGTVLRPQDIGVLVSLGHADVDVVQKPRVAIIATGDELVDVHETPLPGQIRNSNSCVLAALVQQYGGVPFQMPVVSDTLDDVRQRFLEALSFQPDMIVSSAGVSVGTHDVVRTVVEELGHLDIWRVNLRPGKPLAFGHVRQVPYFGLPGNPVSTMVTFDIFVRAALVKAGGGDPRAMPITTAVLGENVTSDGRRTYLRVTLTERNGELVAHTTGTQSSGALMSMVLADGLLILPEGLKQAQAGERYPVRLLRPMPGHFGS